MRSLLLGIALAVLPALVSAQVEDGYAGQRGFEFRKKQLAERAAVRVQPAKENMPVVDAHVTPPFYTSASKKFYVDGTKIPDVNWDAGPSYSGLMPISGAKNETRKLFFWQVLQSVFTQPCPNTYSQVLADDK
jgi:hypothetical protein